MNRKSHNRASRTEVEMSAPSLPPGIVSGRPVVAAKSNGKGKGKKPTQTDLLIKIARDLYDLRVDEVRQDVIGVPKSGPRVAVRLKGRSAVSGHLLREFYARHGAVPGTQAMTQTLALIEAQAGESEPVRTYMRSARPADDLLVIDLGTLDGDCVVINGGKWSVRKSPPDGVLFRRTAATLAMPLPLRRGSLSELRGLFALDKETWDLVRAWLVLAWLEDIPVPVLGLLGPNGAGKSFLAKTVVQLVDPAPAPLRRLPAKKDDWPIIANGSRVIGLDNISRMTLDVSDDISRAVTGEGDEKRALFTNEDQVIFNYRRAFVLTSIDPGAMQGDFAERLMAVNLRRIDRGRRRGEREMEVRIREIMPSLLGALLSAVARVLASPVDLDELPRMADAARVMAALDVQANDSDALAAYERSLGTSVERVLESDPIAETILTFMRPERRVSWEGTPTELYEAVTTECMLPEHNWPANAQKLSERLMRISTALHEGKGLRVERGERDHRYLALSWDR